MQGRWLIAAATGLLAWIPYLATLAPGLTWAHDGADGGDLAAAVLSVGVPHPTGYPAYVVLGQLFALCPAGDVAWRLNLLSAVCAAVAVALVCALIQRILPNSGQSSGQRAADLAAAGAALCLAFSPVFWSQAVITEVYALEAVFVAAVLLMARTMGAAHAAIWLVLGVGLGNQLSLILVLPAVALMASAGHRYELARDARRLLRCGLAFVAGLAVYLYVPLSAVHDPLVNWGDAWTWDGFAWLVTGQAYRHYLFGLPTAELPGRAANWAGLLARQFTWPGVALTLLGLWDMLTRADQERRAAWGWLASCVLYTIYALGYRTTDSYIYLIPSYIIATLWLGRGLHLLLVWADRLARPGSQAWPVAVGVVPALLVVWQLQTNGPVVDVSRDRVAQDFVQQAFADLPANALIVTSSDEHTFALWYGQASRERSDVVVLDRDLTQYAWYRKQMARRMPAVAALQALDEPASYIAAAIDSQKTARPVYLAGEDAGLRQQFAWQPAGVLQRLVSH